jgi:hypothetical protein
MFQGFLIALSFASILSASASDTKHVALGDQCKTQAIEFIDTYFNGEVKITQIITDSADKSGILYWMKTNACKGYIVVEIAEGSKKSCSGAHYGRIPNYLFQAWARGECKNLIPSPIYL